MQHAGSGTCTCARPLPRSPWHLPQQAHTGAPLRKDAEVTSCIYFARGIGLARILFFGVKGNTGTMLAGKIWSISSFLLAVLLSRVESRFDIETGGLKIKLPTDAAATYRNGFEIALANFGSPKYGGQLLARLVYVDAAHGYPNTHCTPDCRYACQNFSEAQPSAFKLSPSASDPNTILLVDRGPQGDQQACKFAQKVLNAQQAGAQGVLVVNYEDRLTTMEAPDEQDEASYQFLRNITIPAAFITKSDGDVLKNLLQPSSSGETAAVYVVFDWNDVLPRRTQVNWEFWTNSNDQCGAICDVQKEFIREFAPAAKELEGGNWTRFTPHFILWICPVSYRQTQECQSQCIHQGRYCTPDPDGDLQEGYSGREIVQENLRQLCVYKLGNESGKPWVWWEYVTKFSDQCSMDANNYGTECAERIWGQIGGNEWSSLDALHDCIGDIDANVPNDIFEAEMLRQRGDETTGEVYILPTIRINNGQYRGKLAYTEVLRAICASFPEDSEPRPCLSVAEDDCRPGSAGVANCSNNMESGRTKCVNTFSGFDCTCGDGFVASGMRDGLGNEICTPLNQCVAGSQLPPDCSCERCACAVRPGGYECKPNLPNECEINNGNCWQETLKVNGQSQTFSACRDNIRSYKYALSTGKDANLSTCVCPPCFTTRPSGGCEPKQECGLDSCNLATGECNATAAAAGTSTWAVLLIVVGALAVVAVVAYAAYRLRIRSAMHQEIRDIMAQYMPLESNEGAADHRERKEAEVARPNGHGPSPSGTDTP